MLMTRPTIRCWMVALVLVSAGACASADDRATVATASSAATVGSVITSQSSGPIAATTPSILAPAATGTPSPVQHPSPLDHLDGLNAATQAIVVTAPNARSTVGTLRAYERSDAGWSLITPDTRAHLGYGGLSDRHHEGDGTTPIGNFGFVYAFGSQPDPGSALGYHPIVQGSCWGGSGAGSEYNRWRQLPRCAPNDEDLVAYGTHAYRYAAVIDYNYAAQTPGAGSAIFLHVDTGGSTAGCVSVPEPAVVQLLKWLRPGARIIIGIDLFTPGQM